MKEYQNTLERIGEKESVKWGDILNKPGTYAPSAHGHCWSDIANPPSTYAPTEYTHDERYYTEAEKFLEPDIPPVHISAIWLKRLLLSLPGKSVMASIDKDSRVDDGVNFGFRTLEKITGDGFTEDKSRHVIYSGAETGHPELSENVNCRTNASTCYSPGPLCCLQTPFFWLYIIFL